MLATIDAANDDFIRTTEPRHKERVQLFWETVRDNGYVYEADYEGPYCVGCEEFKLPGDLVSGPEGDELCPVHQRPVEMLKETNWFFRLSAFTDALIAHYEADPSAIEPQSAYNEVMSFLRNGLVDISMSRSSVRRASSSMAWPAGVSATPVRVRANSALPSRDSARPQAATAPP